mgnify:CR=1 FL=1
MLRSSSNNSWLFLTSGENLKNSKSLKYFEGELPRDIFVRVSKSYIVNINHVDGYSKEDGGTINLSSNCFAALSDKYRDDFFQA